MRASIVIAAHNEGDRLWRTVGSCVETAAGLDCEIVVADDDSYDGSVDETQRRFPQVRVLRSERRIGSSATKDRGAREARGETLIFLDGHTKPEPGAIERLIDDVERTGGEAVITPAVAGLDVARWKPLRNQVGHGYFLELERFDCGWLPLRELREHPHRGRMFYESPALIGCALAVHRELYDDLRGFDPHMLSWGVEDLDFGLKSWLMGHPILHDPEAVIAHRFRERFDNFAVPIEELIHNQLRMARKNFTHGVWAEWVDRCRRRYPGRLAEHPEGLWAAIWDLFESHRPSVQFERSYLFSRRIRDEFWYAERFNLLWPRLSPERYVPGPTAGLEAEAQAQPSPSPSPSPPPPCGATVRFLDNENNPIPPDTHALNVSNWIADEGLPRGIDFNNTNDDPDNFRLEVVDDEVDANSVTVTLQIGTGSPETYTLDNRSGNTFRGEFLRLVTDVPDAASGNGDPEDQRILISRFGLGQTVVLRYQRAGSDCEDIEEIDIGRPVDENNNGANQLLHDIRELTLHVVVFSTPGTTSLDGAIDATQTTIPVESVANMHPGPAVVQIEDEVIRYFGLEDGTNNLVFCTRGYNGTTAAGHADATPVQHSTTTPVVSRFDVNDHVVAVDERFAQSTIRVQQPFVPDLGGTGDPGVPLPPELLDGEYIRNSGPVFDATDDELAVAEAKDSNDDSVDVFYVPGVIRDGTGLPSRATAYPEERNRTGDANLQNFIVISADAVDLTLPHELLHILLNGPHRTGEDDRHLFRARPRPPGKAVDGPKRIGPYPEGTAALPPSADDTTTIRTAAEDLP